MTATFAELTFSVFFLVFMNVVTLFALTSEEQGLRAISAIVALIDRVVAWSFPHHEEGQAASQPELILSVCSQPVVRIAS